MPKRVDREERRREIAKALWRIIRDRGLESVSLRHVAAEADLSMGAVQHYFSTKDEMLLFALRYMNEQSEQRVRERVLASADPHSPYEILRACALEMLPMEEASRTGLAIAVAYSARALSSPELAEVVRQGRPEVVGFFAGMLSRAQQSGDLAEGVDPVLEAEILLSLVEGLGAQALLGNPSPEQAAKIVEYQLGRLFPNSH